MAYMEIKDYSQITKDRLTDFFTDKPVFWHYLQLITNFSQSLQQEIANVGLKRWIDTATGAQLDIIGNIVGQDRYLYGADLIEWFGYYPFLSAQAYGDQNNAALGGYYRDEGVAEANDVRLSDNQYRLFIKGKIMKNVIVPTPENVIRFIEFVFNVPLVKIQNNGYGKVDIIVYSDDLTNYEKAIIQYSFEGKNFINYFVPKTLGVMYNITIEDVPTNNFGFLTDSSAKSFGSVENNNGGIYYSVS